MILIPIGNPENVARTLKKGDLLAEGAAPQTLNGAAGLTVTPLALVSGIVFRTGTLAGAANDTFPTADQIIAAASPDAAHRVGKGTQWRVRYINVATTQTITNIAAANSGVSIVGTATIATATWREYLLEVLAPSPPQILAGSTTNANPTVTITGNAIPLSVLLEPGMAVSGTGIQAGTTILGINSDANSITLSLNANATGAGVSLTFVPTVSITNIGGGTA